MKKVILAPIAFAMILSSGCSSLKHEESTQDLTKESSGEYVSANLGIKFEYPEGFEDKAIEEENKIFYPEWIPNMYIAVFEKPADEKMEDAIMGLIEEKAKNPENCRVVAKGEYWANPKYESFNLDLANPNISYSDEELEEIKLADLEAEEDGGPFDGEWKKREIYNKRLVENCSEYAEPLGLGTSKSIGSLFLYSESMSKTKFIFLPGTTEPYFHKEGSITFIKE